ncbi:MAG: HEPN domain-containing protein [Hyphomicrobiales bacterium]
MAERKLIQEWLQKADEDLNFAASIIEDSTFYAQICFHFQQAAEKYLKALVVADDLEFQKIHDLVTLLKICSASRPDIATLMPSCKLLNRFYTDTRYPVHWPTDYSKDKAAQAQAAAEKIRDTIKAYLGQP